MVWQWATLMFLMFSGTDGQTAPKVVVLGFDGADYTIVADMLAAGELPNLASLRDRGGFAPLLPTNPPQTPVSWSTFATGINPGRTGIFDFIRRRPGSYIPDLALSGETTETVLFGKRNSVYLPTLGFAAIFLMIFLFTRKRGRLTAWGLPLVLAGAAAWGIFFVAANWIPATIPGVVTVRQGKPIWKILEEQGKSATIIRLPVTFPAESLNGEMIAGLATPDIRGTIGKPSIYTNDLGWEVGDNQFSVEIYKLSGASPYQTAILGPPNKLFYNAESARLARQAGQVYEIPKNYELPLTITVTASGVDLAAANETISLAPKQWSDWIQFNYKVNPLITLKGFGRFYLDWVRGDKFKLYLSPINLHPEMPLPLSYPKSLAAKIWREEPYKTMGWALDTWSIGNGLMDEQHFLEDIDFTVTRYEKLMEEFLAANEHDLFVQVFSFTDRIGHILWRYWDEGHPHFDAEKGPIYQEAMRNAYRRMDRIVGRAMAILDKKGDGSVLLVCSDHGFASFRYQFNTNTWLVENGFLKLKKNVLGQPMKLDDLQSGTTPFSVVDWEHTKAYSLGLGMIFINLAGREPEGSVQPEDYDGVAREIAAGLEAYVDEQTGIKPIKRVFFRDEMYKGYDPATTPDLRAANAPMFRVSWDTTLGGMPKDITSVNPQNWSGDHCSMDPQDVRGILFSSVPLRNPSPEMADLCPSMLHLLGVTTEIDMDGKPVF